MKVSCQATCQKCYQELSRRQDLDANDFVWYCSSCNRIYLCEIGLARLGSSYSCPYDHTIVVREEVDKSMIKKEGIPGSNDQSREELYHKLRGRENDSKIKGIKDSKKLSAYHRYKISELSDIETLTISLLLEIIKIPEYQIKNAKKINKTNVNTEFLEIIGEKNGKIIDFLYSALFKFENIPYALEIRFAVCIPFILSNISRIEFYKSRSSKFNLHLYNKMGEETLVYCTNDDMDIKDVEKLAKDVFTIDFKKYTKVKRVFLVANSFSYMARCLLKKYESALTAINGAPDNMSTALFKSIPISLWQPILGKLEFRNVSLK
ncbi:MAG: hypothetical protein ACFFAU_14935 [Candidatus Hodarchaeota archaeon]